MQMTEPESIPLTDANCPTLKEGGFVRPPFLDSGDGKFLEFARLPTTVGEFKEFVDFGGYERKAFWSARGWAWKEEHRIAKPKYWAKTHYCELFQPVTGVSFWEAEAYAAFRGCSLPTEAEWFCVATNGFKSLAPWGTTKSVPIEVDKQAHLSFFGTFSKAKLAPVTQSIASGSEAGVRDLIGNVSEWTFPGEEPLLKENAQLGLLCGGSWWNTPFGTDSYFRDVAPLAVRDNQTGIRLVRRHGVIKTGYDKTTRVAKLMSYGKPISRPTKAFRQEGIPKFDISDWRLSVTGVNIEPREFSFNELRTLFKVHNQTGLFVCVCRWGEINEFTGISIEDILTHCGADLSSKGRELYIKQRSMPGKGMKCYETSVKIDHALQSGAILAYMMDGKPLTPELGWPLRYIDFSLYGYKGVKCLSELTITDQFSRGWWEEKCHYDIDGTIRQGTITIVGEDAKRFEIERDGTVSVPNELLKRRTRY
jgi:DMSO/TMAO reductase YedYZ molybdopterin-dependent catalytic subunit